MIPAPLRAADLAGRWLRRPRPVRNPRIRLVCLPHAGGTAGAFYGWPATLPADVELVAVQYPGRQDRFGEPCPRDMRDLADRVAEAVLPLSDRPVALFGHSMGAVLAYEVTVRLEQYRAAPRRLFVSGHASPTLSRERRDLHLCDDTTMVRGLLDMGGMNEAVTEDPELLELLLPSLRADLRLIETYRPSAPCPVHTPVTAHVGDADPGVPVPDAVAWSALASGGFSWRVFPGGHFHLFDQRTAVVSDVSERLAPAR